MTKNRSLRAQLYTSLFLFSFMTVFLYSNVGSPLYEFCGSDGIIFRIIGRGVTKGYLPYRDLFDHKGPLVFYIYALPELTGHFKWTMTLIQTLFLFVSLMYLYRISCLYLPKLQSLVPLSFSLVYVAIMMDDGAQCEFFELPFISAALYYIIRNFQGVGNTDSLRLGFKVGLCFIIVFLMRINDAVCPIGVALASFTLSIALKRQWKAVFRICIGFSLGFLVIALPFFVYFFCEDILYDVLYGMLLFNIKYANQSWANDYTLKIAILTLMLILSIAALKRSHKHRSIIVWFVIPVLVSCIFTIGNRPFLHYYIILAPIFTILISVCFNIFLLMSMAWILLIGGWNIGTGKVFYGSLIHTTYKNFKMFKENQIIIANHEAAKRLIEVIPEDERNEIWNYNLSHGKGMDVFIAGDVLPSNQFFVPQHKFFDDGLVKSENIFNSLPKWVIVSEDFSLIAEMEQIDKDKERFKELYTCINSSIIDGLAVSVYRRN